MKDSEIYIFGGVALVGLGLGAYFLLKKPGERVLTKDKPFVPAVFATPAVTPSPSPSSVSIVSQNPIAVTPSPVVSNSPSASSSVNVTPDTAIILASQQKLREEQEKARLESEARAKADAERIRLLEIRGFEDRAAAVENLMLIDLGQIQTIENDNSRLNDFQEIALRDLFGSAEWKAEVAKCQQFVHSGCGTVDPFWGCRNHYLPMCDSREAMKIWSADNPVVSWAIPRSRVVASEQLAKWKYNEKLPSLSRLAERETTYRGIVIELKNSYGITYNPKSPEAHLRANSSATVLQTAPDSQPLIYRPQVVRPVERML